MNRKSTSPALHIAANEPPPLLGFTAWVTLRSEGAASVLAYRRSLDHHLASRGLVRSMNPLHMLVWSPERVPTAADQVELLAWMAFEGRAERVSVGSLHHHCGIPSLRGQTSVLAAQLSDLRWLPVFQAYFARQCSAEQVLDVIRQAGCAARV